MNHQISALLDKMESTTSAWETAGDNRYIFLKCYTIMSRNMAEGISAGRFADPEWVSRLMAVFADYYFEALFRYEISPDATPAVWRQAHACAEDTRVKTVQHLMLGINAHINYDLPLSLYDCLCHQWSSLEARERYLRKQDHNTVNAIIAESIDSVQDIILAPRSKALKMLDVALGRTDEWLIAKAITSWRSRVWNISEQMLGYCDNEEMRRSIIRNTEQDALKKADLILLGKSGILG